MKREEEDEDDESWKKRSRRLGTTEASVGTWLFKSCIVKKRKRTKGWMVVRSDDRTAGMKG